MRGLLLVEGPVEAGDHRLLDLRTAEALGGQGEILELEAGRSSGSASVSVVETTDLGLGHDPPLMRTSSIPMPRTRFAK